MEETAGRRKSSSSWSSSGGGGGGGSGTPTLLDNIFTSIFQRQGGRSRNSNSPRASDEGGCDSPKPLSFLSPLANSVVSRSAKILKKSTEELQNSFDEKMAAKGKLPRMYSRNFLEFCSYKALDTLCARADYLSDKDFRRLTFDMMLAWEAPGVENESLHKEMVSPSKVENENDDGWSLFYSSSTDMAVQVDNEKTVGEEAFARIAPGCAVIADFITVHNLFDALTSSSSHRLHFLIYDKYLQTLHRVIKMARNALESSSNLELHDGEIVLDVDGTVPTQPVLQHIGISAWPGRLTLSNLSLHFESLGVGQYDKPARYDLSMDAKQVIKPELTGPLGARLFDKAVMYRSALLDDPVYLEFPEFKGSSRRDYWLDITLEILRVHRFVRKYHLNGIQKSEAIARAILGIFHCRAVREAFHLFPSHYRTLLAFNLAENLPGGDKVLETLSRCLTLLETNNFQADRSETASADKVYPVSLLLLSRFGLILQKDVGFGEQTPSRSGYTCAGEVDPLEVAVKQSKLDTGKAEAAQETVDQVKVDGIDTNLAVMKELLFPLIFLSGKFRLWTSWEEPLKSTVVLLLINYMIYSGWIGFVLPSVLVFLAVLMLWRRHVKRGKPVDAFRIIVPPNKNAVEQLITLQEAISQVEVLVQSTNIILLKTRALLFAILPQATYSVAILLLVMALILVVVPWKFLVLFFFTEAYTRDMPLRRESTYKGLRRIREWWYRIPAAPVQLIKTDTDKKRK